MDATVKIISCCEKGTPAILGISVSIFKLDLRRAAGKELLKSEKTKETVIHIQIHTLLLGSLIIVIGL